MESLLDEADAWISSEDEYPPNFTIPEIYAQNGTIVISSATRATPVPSEPTTATITATVSSVTNVTHSSPYIELRDTALASSSQPQPQRSRGYGWYSKQFIPGGTIIMVAKPIAMVMEWEDDDTNDDVNDDNVHSNKDRTTSTNTTSSTITSSTPQQQLDTVESTATKAENGEDDENIIDNENGEDDDFIDDDIEDDFVDEEEDGDDVIAEDEDIGFENEQPSDAPLSLVTSTNKNNLTTKNNDTTIEGGAEEPEPHINEILLLRIVQRLLHEPYLWTDQLHYLYPRTEMELLQLPSWVCHDDQIFMQIEEIYSQLISQHIFTMDMVRHQIGKRLPLIIRYNILSIETSCELLSYPTNGYMELAGVGLYYLPSYFNHSRYPNTNRWAVGDVMGFVTNQNIPPNTELCISYLEHDILCENSYRRNQMLRMDFLATDDDDQQNKTMPENDDDDMDNGPDMPVVDSDVQNELMSMNPLERLIAIDELYQQALGGNRSLASTTTVAATSIESPHGGSMMTILPAVQERHNDDEVDDMLLHESDSMMMNHSNSALHTLELSSAATLNVPIPKILWFQCDIHNLRILKAITLDGLGQNIAALQLWEESILFVRQYMPPFDESSIVLHVQAALCSIYISYDPKQSQHEEYKNRAKQHAIIALRQHILLFGGTISLFRRRFYHDFILPLRPLRNHPNQTLSQQQELYVNQLWPIRVDDNELVEL